jgi:hypothetical protein
MRSDKRAVFQLMQRIFVRGEHDRSKAVGRDQKPVRVLAGYCFSDLGVQYFGVFFADCKGDLNKGRI